MKHFKLFKSLTVGLLALALVFGIAGATKVSAEEPEPTTYTATFTAVFNTKTYTYVVDPVEAKQSIKIDDILAGMTTGTGDDKVKLEGAMFSAVAGTPVGCSYVAEKKSIVVGDSLTANVTATLTLVPEKIKVTLGGAAKAEGAPEDAVSVEEYSYVWEVENGKKSTLDPAVVATGLSKTETDKTTFAEDDLGYELVVVGPASAVNGVSIDDTGKYSIDFTETLATEDITAAGTVTAYRVFKAEYDVDNDQIVVTTHSANQKLYYASVKSTNGADLKLNSFKDVTSENVGTKDAPKYQAVISLTDKEAGFKQAENKDIFVYLTTRKPAEAKAKYKPNFVVKGNTDKLSAVGINYAKASAEITDTCVITSITVKKGKTTVVYAPSTTDAAADTAFTAKLATLVYKVGEGDWTKVTGNMKKAEDGTDVRDYTKDFTGKYLSELIAAEKATKVSFKLLGTVEAPAAGETPAVDNVRCCKLKAVSVAITPKAANVKVDFVKGTVALKNGYDYSVSGNKNLTTIAIANWTTILPYNKNGTEEETGTIANSAYVPQAKFTTANAGNYTKVKISKLPVVDLCENIWGTANVAYIYMRKAATAKKPATAFICAEVLKPAAAPVMTATSDAYATDAEEEKKGTLTIPEIAKAASDTKADDNFEYLVVKKEDLGTFDITAAKWAKLETGKTITVGKTKSTYTLGDKKVTATLSAEGNTYILVRRKADKANEALASEYAITILETGKATVDGKEIDVISWKAKQLSGT